jgi:hypothetical protein
MRDLAGSLEGGFEPNQWLVKSLCSCFKWRRIIREAGAESFLGQDGNYGTVTLSLLKAFGFPSLACAGRSGKHLMQNIGSLIPCTVVGRADVARPRQEQNIAKATY